MSTEFGPDYELRQLKVRREELLDSLSELESELDWLDARVRTQESVVFDAKSGRDHRAFALDRLANGTNELVAAVNAGAERRKAGA